MIISWLIKNIFVTLWKSKTYRVMKQYSTNLTDNQWQFTEKIIGSQERKRKNSLTTPQPVPESRV